LLTARTLRTYRTGITFFTFGTLSSLHTRFTHITFVTFITFGSSQTLGTNLTALALWTSGPHGTDRARITFVTF
jgi:hypothetical protein